MVVIAAACGGDPVGAPAEDETTDSSGPWEIVAPRILAAPDVVARGGRIYVLLDSPLSTVDIELADTPLLDLEVNLRADQPGAIFLIPPQVPVGPTTLGVRFRSQPEALTLHDVQVVEPRFAEVSEPTGLAQLHDAAGSPADCAESHTGLAFGDIDADGNPDVLLGNVGSASRVYRNLGDLDGDGLPDFQDQTEALGLDGLTSTAMATFVDIEGDGDVDLFVGRRGPNRVFRNRLIEDGTASFEDVTAELGLGVENQRTMGVAFGDYDGDDDLDLYVVNHAFCFPTQGSEVRARDHLYRNEAGVFVERTAQLGGPVLESVGFSASWVDIERDGDQDLVVINDAVGGAIGFPNALWRNDGPGDTPQAWNFTNVAEESGVALPGVNGMGLALGDVDGDGSVDMAFSNIGANVLLLNDGTGQFHDVSDQAGIERARLPWDRTSITWAMHLWDHDDDGDLDLYFSGGRIKGNAPIPDAMFDNRGDGTFEDISWRSGLADPAHGKASALVDLDRDGAWEPVTTAWGDPLRVYHNVAARPLGNHWIDVELQGRGGNREAVGAIVELTADGRTQTCFHTNRPSLGAGGETPCHFGLGASTTITALRIEWADGSSDEPSPPDVDQRIRYVQQ